MNSYTTNYVSDLWEMDLADTGPLVLQNDGHSYVLNAIDALSKYA